MKKLFLIPLLVVATLALVNAQDFISSETKEAACYVTGKIATHAVVAGAFAICNYTLKPEACTIGWIAFRCATDPACNRSIDKLVYKGCKFTVEKVNDEIHIIGEATKDGLENLYRIYEDLNTVEGITFLMQYLN